MTERVSTSGALRVSVDRDKCIGSGMCTSLAPKMFDLDAEGKLVVILPVADSAEQIAGLRDAAACCPVEAISVADLDRSRPAR